MFKSLKRIVYPVADLAQAKEWYSGILGKQPVFDAPFAAIFKVGDCSLSLAKKETSPPEASERTETYWEVDDIEATFDSLVAAGAKVHTPIENVMNIRTAKVVDPFGNIIGLTGPVAAPHKRTIEEQPSATAMSTAFCRALSAKDEREEIRGPDNLAELFLTDEGRKLLKDCPSRQWARYNLVTSPLYGYLAARTRYFDAVFAQGLTDHIPQIVILGAGYDSRAIRFREQLENTRVFELDITSTQKRKLEILRTANIEIPSRVSFVSINFKLDPLESVLTSAGFDPGVESLFIWEGVTYYLAEESVRKTLGCAGKHSAAGSTICFDVMTEELESVNAGEPFLFWIGTGELRGLLNEYGFDVVEHLDAQEMQRRYLTLRDGTLAEKTLPQFSCARGLVRKRT